MFHSEHLDGLQALFELLRASLLKSNHVQPGGARYARRQGRVLYWKEAKNHAGLDSCSKSSKLFRKSPGLYYEVLSLSVLFSFEKKPQDLLVGIAQSLLRLWDSVSANHRRESHMCMPMSELLQGVLVRLLQSTFVRCCCLTHYESSEF